jgi:hypothetical protein
VRKRMKACNSRLRPVVAVFAASTAALSFVSSGVLAGATAVPRLHATVGPGRTISLRTPSAESPPRLRAGIYTIVVRDRSRRDNFHLVGPGVSRKTRKAFVGTRHWRVTLRKGIYRYRSDAHPRLLAGSFRVS